MYLVSVDMSFGEKKNNTDHNVYKHNGENNNTGIDVGKSAPSFQTDNIRLFLSSFSFISVCQNLHSNIRNYLRLVDGRDQIVHFIIEIIPLGTF